MISGGLSLQRGFSSRPEILLVQQATGLFSSPPRWTLLVNNALGCADDTTLMAESDQTEEEAGLP